jgi:sugar phosphate permease
MRRAWRMLAAAVLAQFGSSVVEQGLPTLTGFVKQDLGLSAAAAGLVASSINIGRAAGAFRAGRAADDFGERRVLVVGGICAGLLTVIAVTLPLVALIPGLIVTGVFVSAATPAGGKFVLRAFPVTHRAFALGVRQTGTPLGGIAAAVMLPLLASHWGWRTALAVAGVFAALAALSVLPIGGAAAEFDELRTKAPKPTTTFRAFLRERDIVLLSLWAATMVSAQYALVAFVALDASQRAHVSLAKAALLVAIAQGGGVIGRLGWGLISDRVLAGARKPVLIGLTAVAAGVALTLTVTPEHLGYWTYGVIAAFGGLSMIGWQGMWMTALAERAGAERAGAATGFSLTFVTIASAGAPPFYGLIHDVAGTFRASWGVLALLIIVSAVPVVRMVEKDVTDRPAR